MSLLNQYLKMVVKKKSNKESPMDLPCMLKARKNGGLYEWKSVRYWLLIFVSVIGVTIFTWRYDSNQVYSDPLFSVEAQAKADADDDRTEEAENPELSIASKPDNAAVVSKPSSDSSNQDTYSKKPSQPDSPEVSVSVVSDKLQNNPTDSYPAEESERKISYKIAEDSNRNQAIPSYENLATPMESEKIPQEAPINFQKGYQVREAPIIPVVTSTSEKSKSGKPSLETAQSFYQLGIIALQEGDLPSAERYFRETIKHTPDNIDALLNLSTVYIQQKRMESADQMLKRVRQLDPDNLKSMNNLAYIALYRKDFNEARLYYEAVLRINPAEEMALTNLAYVAQAENNQAEALYLYNRIISLNPQNGTALIKAAHILTQEGKIEQAIQYYNNSLSLKTIQDDQELVRKIKQRIATLKDY